MHRLTLCVGSSVSPHESLVFRDCPQALDAALKGRIDQAGSREAVQAVMRQLDVIISELEQD